MSANPSPIYSLLPAVFRTRDAAQGGPLQALFSVLEDQYGIVKQNVWDLYDDQFIETCAPWVIPYLAQLIGYNAVYTEALASGDTRAEVANTIGYRRRKGTLIALEQITHDISGRATMAVEEFRHLVTTLSLRDVRPHHNGTANLRRAAVWQDQVGPFTRLNRTIDVRNIAPRVRGAESPDTTPLDIALHGGGHFNIPNIAVWMWRWASQSVVNAPAFALGNGGFFFDALGGPRPLFQTVPEEPTPFARLVTEQDVPEPINLERFQENVPAFYPSSLRLVSDGQLVAVDQIVAANLAERADGSVCRVPKGKIAIDPEQGRIQYASDVSLPRDLRVTYNHGAAAEIAGGGYDRSANLKQPGTDRHASFVNSSAPFFALVGSTQYPTLSSAIVAWNTLPPRSAGTIVLPNFESYTIDLTAANAIHIPAESSLLIASATLTQEGVPQWKNACVTLHGNIEIVAPPLTMGADGIALPAGQVQFSGLWISGQVILSGSEALVQIADCTLVPGITRTHKGEPAHPELPSIVGNATGAMLCVQRSVIGPIMLQRSCSVRICDSVVDAASPYCPAIAGSGASEVGPSLYIEGSTVIGRVWVQAIRLASNTIFHARLGKCDPWKAAVWAVRVQIGCVRFCWLPWNSITPRRYECLPPDAPSEAALQPSFITLRFGQPGYCMLSGRVPLAIWKGADNGSQIGVFHQTQETQAVTNIQIRSGEYLPANLQSGVFLIPSTPLPEEAVHMGYGYGQRSQRCGCADGDEEDLLVGIGSGLI